jgi:fructose-specific phosphotransferase system IIC component
MMVLFMVLFIPLLIIFGVLAISTFVFNTLLAHATGVVAVILIVLETIVGLFAFVLGLFVSISLGGPIATWIRNYALLFYGGRYQALGDILSPPPPAAPNIPEVA